MGRTFETGKIKRIKGWSWYNQGKAEKCILFGVDGARWEVLGIKIRRENWKTTIKGP